MQNARCFTKSTTNQYQPLFLSSAWIIYNPRKSLFLKLDHLPQICISLKEPTVNLGLKPPKKNDGCNTHTHTPHLADEEAWRRRRPRRDLALSLNDD